MDLFVKLVIVAVLLLAVILISVNSNRTITFEEFEEVEEFAVGTSSASNIGNVQNVQGNQQNMNNSESIAEKIETTQNTSKEEAAKAEISQSPQSVQQNTQESLALSNQKSLEVYETVYNEVVNPLPKENLNSASAVEAIYSEMKEVEQGVRRYISKGYKMSTLNIENVEKEGLINQQLKERYEVTFNTTDDGYNIFIICKFEVDKAVKEELLKNKNITLVDDKLSYKFWIKAYR